VNDVEESGIEIVNTETVWDDSGSGQYGELVAETTVENTYDAMVAFEVWVTFEFKNESSVYHNSQANVHVEGLEPGETQTVSPSKTFPVDQRPSNYRVEVLRAETVCE
jgi:hypothetical protein